MPFSVLQYEIVGTHTGGAASATLVDSSVNFLTGARIRAGIGDIVYNITKGASGIITNVAANEITAPLNGGNTWDVGNSYRIWSTEQYLYDLSITDTLGFPMALEALIGNKNNTAETAYNVDYQKVRIIEKDTGSNLIIFYGKIETSDPYWDNQYGQVLKISARDNLAELLKRTVRDDYTAAILQADLTNGDPATGITRRSQLIKRIINDYQFQSTNIDVTTADFTISLSDLSYVQLASNFTGAGKNALRAILDLAQSEAWNAITSNNTGFAYDYYLDTDFININGTPSTPSPDLHYFMRGTIPSTNPAVDGLTVQYLGTAGNQTRQMLHDYNFSTESRELITRLKSVYMTNVSGNVDTLDCILINHGAVTNGPFAADDIISWNGGVNTATVEYPGNGFLIISSANSNNTWLNTISGQTITSGIKSAVVNTSIATSPGSLRESIEQEIEVITREYEKESKQNAREHLADILVHSNNSLIRGEFSIVYWPTYEIAAVDYVVRVGHVINVVNTNVSAIGAGTNMTVTKIEFHENQSTKTSRISVMGTTSGRTTQRGILENMRDTAETASWETVASTGGIAESVQLVNLRKTADGTEGIFSITNASQITWVGATATYSDGSTQLINAGGATFSSATAYDYGYIEKGSTTLIFGTYAAAFGLNKTIVAMGRINANTGQAAAQKKAILVMVNEGSQTVVDYSSLKVANLSALVSDLGFINAGGIRLASGTTNIVDTTGFSGFTINGERIGGYAAGVLQTELRSSDGHFMAGAGAVEIDSLGVTVKGIVAGYADAMFRLINGTTQYGALYLTNTLTALTSLNGKTLYLGSENGGILLDAHLNGGTGNIEFIADLVFPSSTINFGTSTNYWGAGYIDTMYSQSVLRRSGAGGAIGDSTNYFSNGYFGTGVVSAITRLGGAAGGNIGASNAGFTNAFFDNLYEASTGTGITLRNVLKPASAGGVDLGTSSLPFAKLFVGTDGVNRYISGSSGDMEFVGNGNRTMTLKDEDPGSNSTVLELRVKHGAGDTVEVVLVSLDAADSAGAGYRALRVPNG